MTACDDPSLKACALSSPTPWSVHCTGGQLSIKDARGKVVFRKATNTLPDLQAFERLKADFEIIVLAVNGLPSHTDSAR